MNLSQETIDQFIKSPQDEPPHDALYRYDRATRILRRVSSLWLWVHDEHSLAIVAHPGKVKSAVGGDSEWTRHGEGDEKEWWHPDGHGLVMFPVNPDPALYL